MAKEAFCVSFAMFSEKKLSSAPPKARLMRKARRTQKILRAGCLWVFIYEKSGSDYLTL